jgi:hypothetical protein
VLAVVGELVRGDVVSDATGPGGVGQQVSDHVVNVPLRVGDVLVSVKECPEVGVVAGGSMTSGPFVVDEGVGLQYGLEPPVSIAGLVPGVGELFEVGGDLAVVPGKVVPGKQDGLDVGEVLVQRRPADAGDRQVPRS